MDTPVTGDDKPILTRRSVSRSGLAREGQTPAAEPVSEQLGTRGARSDAPRSNICLAVWADSTTTAEL